MIYLLKTNLTETIYKKIIWHNICSIRDDWFNPEPISKDKNDHKSEC